MHLSAQILKKRARSCISRKIGLGRRSRSTVEVSGFKFQVAGGRLRGALERAILDQWGGLYRPRAKSF